jgi:LysR family transcriptional regulator, nod-box dependent transcriptional activator
MVGAALDDDVAGARHGLADVENERDLRLRVRCRNRAIATLRSLISAGTTFDPATADRRFKIAASDYITTVLLVPLLRSLEHEAPFVRLDITLPADATSARLANGDYDLILTPEEFVDPIHPTELLFEERHVVVGCTRNPQLGTAMTPDQFAGAGHVAVMIDGRNTFIEDALAGLGIARRIEVRAPSFIQVPFLLPGTRRIALMHERLAVLMAPGLDLKVIEPPFPLPLMREVLQYHSSRQKDAGLLWLRARLRELARKNSS